jgi:uncharacterized protein (DUF58 family)
MIRPTRTTGGIAALALALTATALLLDNPAAALAAGSLCLFLFWRCLALRSGLRTAAASLASEREVRPGHPPPGSGQASRSVTVDLAIPHGMEVGCATSAGGSPPARLPSASPAGPRLNHPAPGSRGRRSAGSSIAATRAYFSSDLLVRRFSAPSPEDLSRGDRERPAGRSGPGSQHHPRWTGVPPLEGPSVRGFRRYQVRDGLGRIDWKVSARRGALYVREMTGS